jgi:hypothetical protein
MVAVLLIIAGLLAWYLFKQSQRDKLLKDAVEVVYNSPLPAGWAENGANPELDEHQTLDEWDLENGTQMLFDVCALLRLDDADPVHMKFAGTVIDAVNERCLRAAFRYKAHERLGEGTEEQLAALPPAVQRELRRDGEE